MPLVSHSLVFGFKLNRLSTEKVPWKSFPIRSCRVVPKYNRTSIVDVQVLGLIGFQDEVHRWIMILVENCRHSAHTFLTVRIKNFLDCLRETYLRGGVPYFSAASEQIIHFSLHIFNRMSEI